MPAAEPGRTCAGGWGSCPRRGKAVCAHAGGRGPRLRPRGASRVEHPRPRLAGPGDAASCARGLRDRRRGGLRSARRPSGPAPSQSAGPAGWRFERPARSGGRRRPHPAAVAYGAALCLPCEPPSPAAQRRRRLVLATAPRLLLPILRGTSSRARQPPATAPQWVGRVHTPPTHGGRSNLTGRGGKKWRAPLERIRRIL